MPDKDLDWLGDLRWRGYPRLGPPRELGSDAGTGDAPAARRAALEARPDPRLAELARDNAVLRARLADLSRLSEDFDRRLAEAATASEAAVLEAESRLRDASFERERLSGELSAAKSECARLSARDVEREADLRLERERRGGAERALAEARRRLEALACDCESLRAKLAEQADALEELRRRAGAQNERLLQAKAPADQDVDLLRRELRDFLAKFRRLQDSLGENK